MPGYEKLRRRNNGPTFPVGGDDAPVFASKDDLHVDIKALEGLLDSHAGCKLSKISSVGNNQIDTGKALLRRYSNNGPGGGIRRLVEEFFGEIAKPVAMFYGDINDMARSVLRMYQLSYYHYVLGKYYRMNAGRFPSYCCGISAQNLLVAFWESGIVAATKACTDKYDHAYLIVPFILGSHDQSGVILVDPTSDQLMLKPEEKVRNLIRVMTQERWSYITDWYGGQDLYPDTIEISACYGRSDKDYSRYIKEALKNPVVVV